jgi:hypothetical protein
MTGVVAVVGPPSPSLAAAAEAVAGMLGADLRQVRTEHRDTPHAARTVLAELAAADVVAAVVPVGTGMDAMIGQIISASPKPVVVTPHTAAAEHESVVARVLLPLDGSQEAAAAVAQAIQFLTDAGVDLVVLHVYDRRTAPHFWDQAAHARNCWEPEFRARYCPQRGIRLELRSGAPGEQVVTVAVQEEVDLIILGWSQRLEQDRAATVRRTVREAQVPVMLMPVSR